MIEFFADYGVYVVAVAGMLICLVGGLLSLTPDPENPRRFIPVYIVALAIFIAGLGLITFSGQVNADIVSYMTNQTNGV